MNKKMRAAQISKPDGFWPGLAYPRVPGHEVAEAHEEMYSGKVRFRVVQTMGNQ